MGSPRGARGWVRDKLGPVSRDLLSLTATAAGALIRRRALSPVEYVGTVLEAIERSPPVLNACGHGRLVGGAGGWVDALSPPRSGHNGPR